VEAQDLQFGDDLAGRGREYKRRRGINQEKECEVVV
jgi:hypothetical protein